jgi:hypothetical protein
VVGDGFTHVCEVCVAEAAGIIAAGQTPRSRASHVRVFRKIKSLARALFDPVNVSTTGN